MRILIDQWFQEFSEPLRIWTNELFEAIIEKNDWCGMSKLTTLLKYEFKRFRLGAFLLVFFSVSASVMIALPDAKSFVENDSALPQKMRQNISFTRAIAIGLILVPTVTNYIATGFQSSQKSKILSKTFETILVPILENELNDFRSSKLIGSHQINSARIYVLLPVRIRFLDWRFKVSGKTANTLIDEEKFLLELDEWIVKFTFDRVNLNAIQQLFHTDSTMMAGGFPSLKRGNYTHLTAASPIPQSFIVLPLTDSNIVKGILVVDTDDTSDFDKMKTATMTSSSLAASLGKVVLDSKRIWELSLEIDQEVSL